MMDADEFPELLPGLLLKRIMIFLITCLLIFGCSCSTKDNPGNSPQSPSDKISSVTPAQGDRLSSNKAIEAGRELMVRKDYPGALKEFNRAVELDRSNAWAYHEVGTANVKLGEQKKALMDFQQALRIYPDLYQAHTDMAHCLVEMDEFSKVIDHYSQAEKIILKKLETTSPDTPAGKRLSLDLELVHRGRVIALLKKGDIKEAMRREKEISKAGGNKGVFMEVCPYYLDYVQNLGLKGLNDWKLPAQAFERVITICTNNLASDEPSVEAYLYRGIAILGYIMVIREERDLEIGYYEKADKDLGKYIVKGGTNREAYLWRCRARLRKSLRTAGNLKLAEGAARDGEKYIKLGGGNNDVYLHLGETYYYLRERSRKNWTKQELDTLTQKTIGNFDKYIKAGGNDPSAYSYRGRMHFFHADKEQGKKDMQKYVEIQLPRSAVDNEDIGRLYRYLGKYDKAIEYLNKAIGMDEEVCHSYLERAETYNEMKQYKKAWADYKKSLDIILTIPDKDPEDLEDIKYLQGKLDELKKWQ